MNSISGQLTLLADSLQRPVAELSRQHILEGVLRRLSASMQAESFVLRGGMLVRIWAGPGKRVAEDIDFVGLYPFDVADTLMRLRSVLQNDTEFNDGIRFDEESLTGEATWQETQFPGVRVYGSALIEGQQHSFKIDCGFGDPIVPAAEWFGYPALLQNIAPARVLACRAETAIGWKLQGLVERGARRWRPKDLYDLFLLSGYPSLVETDMIEAIRTAFISRATPVSAALESLNSTAWWQSDRSLKKWNDFQQGVTQDGVMDLGQVITRVSTALRPLLERAA